MTDRWKLLLGSLIVVAMAILAGFIALGRVEEKTSYGLAPVLTILGKFVLDFSEWAFRQRHLTPLDKSETSKPTSTE